MALLSRVAAVNVALSMLGEAPVVSLSPAPTPTAALAESILDEVTRETLSEGWRFNEEREVTLTPDVGGLITLTDVLSVTGERRGLDLVMRGTQLFDLDHNTAVFTGPVTVDLVRDLAWDFIPDQARQYIARRTGRLLNDRVFKDRTRSAIASREEAEARLVLQKSEDFSEPFTMSDVLPQARVRYRP